MWQVTQRMDSAHIVCLVTYNIFLAPWSETLTLVQWRPYQPWAMTDLLLVNQLPPQLRLWFSRNFHRHSRPKIEWKGVCQTGQGFLKSKNQNNFHKCIETTTQIESCQSWKFYSVAILIVKSLEKSVGPNFMSLLKQNIFIIFPS